MTWLQKLAAQQVYFHGTSIANLRSILAEGLSLHHEKVFTPDFSPREHWHSIESYPGIYFSQNLLTSIGAAGQANQKKKLQYGDGRVIVVATIENTSPHIVPDEDAIPDVQSSIAQTMRANLDSSSGWWYAQWAANDFYDIDKAVTNYLEFFKNVFKLTEYHAPMLLNLAPLVQEIMKAHANWTIALWMQRGDLGWGSQHEFQQFKHYQPAEFEQKYRQLMEEFTRRAHRITSGDTDSLFRKNVRSLRPITFRGKNRILAILTINPDPLWSANKKTSYYEQINVMYEAPDAWPPLSEFIRQYQQSITKSFIMRNINTGRIYYDHIERHDD